MAIILPVQSFLRDFYVGFSKSSNSFAGFQNHMAFWTNFWNWILKSNMMFEKQGKFYKGGGGGLRSSEILKLSITNHVVTKPYYIGISPELRERRWCHLFDDKTCIRESLSPESWAPSLKIDVNVRIFYSSLKLHFSKSQLLSLFLSYNLIGALCGHGVLLT